ncbi:hypothetical protein CDAR_18751 [Caerostris darwini]|uniref:Uncharacterized protein n=1 Tax=Caerostris darwini TaxID=1538125 RepID=A0AAV4WD82_9ARAC|nr:hypothetical protein CDAR_18751 [Caerostris darwini]
MEPKLTSRTRRTTARSSPRSKFDTTLFFIFFFPQNKHTIPLHCFNGCSHIANIFASPPIGVTTQLRIALTNGNMEPKLTSRTRRTTVRSSPRRDPVIHREAESCCSRWRCVLGDEG